jgi:hypothetical protein
MAYYHRAELDQLKEEVSETLIYSPRNRNNI